MVEREDEGFMNIFEKWFPNGLLIGERPEYIDTITDEEYMQRFEEDRYKYGDKPVFMSKEEKFCILMGTLCVISWVIMVVLWLIS